MRAPTTPHVVLVGLMGSGKTSVGRLLSRRLGRPMIDNDEELERRTGAAAAEISERDGELALHALESDILLDAIEASAPTIVVAAASVADDDRCLDMLRSPAVEVVWLRGRPSTLAARAASSDHRPIDGDVEDRLAEQAARRDPRYAQVATHVVDVELGNPADISELLLARLRRVTRSPGG